MDKKIQDAITYLLTKAAEIEKAATSPASQGVACVYFNKAHGLEILSKQGRIEEAHRYIDRYIFIKE